MESESETVEAVREFLRSSGPNVIIDITSLPKRFFFPAVKYAMQDASKALVLATYTLPSEYGGPPLQAELSAPSYLPAFLPSVAEVNTSDPGLLIAAIGFEADGLEQVMDEGSGKEVRFLFPAPSAPPFFDRAWRCLHRAQRLSGINTSQVLSVSVRDVGGTYERLCGLTNMGQRPSVLAPYGPKTVSLAMALFAAGPGRDSSSVRYTQPKHYSCSYSLGPAYDESGVVAFAYVLRMHGRNLF